MSLHVQLHHEAQRTLLKRHQQEYDELRKSLREQSIIDDVSRRRDFAKNEAIRRMRYKYRTEFQQIYNDLKLANNLPSYGTYPSRIVRYYRNGMPVDRLRSNILQWSGREARRALRTKFHNEYRLILKSMSKRDYDLANISLVNKHYPEYLEKYSEVKKHLIGILNTLIKETKDDNADASDGNNGGVLDSREGDSVGVV